MRRTKEEAEVTRQTLMEAGLKVFSQKGYADTTLDDIAEEAGVTRGAIYHHFGCKADLFNAVVTKGWERMMPVIERALAEGGTALEKLRRAFIFLLTYAEQDAIFRAVNELVLFKTAVTPELEDGLQMQRDGARSGVYATAALIRQGIDEGSVRADVDPLDAGILIIAVQNGLMAGWLRDPEFCSLKGRAEAMADIVFSGLAPRS